MPLKQLEARIRRRKINQIVKYVLIMHIIQASKLKNLGIIKGAF